MIKYRFKIMPSGVRLENVCKVLGQNMSIEDLNSMPSEARQSIFYFFCCFI